MTAFVGTENETISYCDCHFGALFCYYFRYTELHYIMGLGFSIRMDNKIKKKNLLLNSLKEHCLDTLIHFNTYTQTQTKTQYNAITFLDHFLLIYQSLPSMYVSAIVCCLYSNEWKGLRVCHYRTLNSKIDNIKKIYIIYNPYW